MDRRAFIGEPAATSEAYFLPNDELLEFNNLNLEDRLAEEEEADRNRAGRESSAQTGAIHVPQVRRARSHQQQQQQSILALPSSRSALAGSTSSTSLPKSHRVQCGMLVLEEPASERLGDMTSQTCSEVYAPDQAAGAELGPQGYHQHASVEPAYLSPLDSYYVYPGAAQPGPSTQSHQVPVFSPQTQLFDAYSQYTHVDEFVNSSLYTNSQLDYQTNLDPFEQQQQQHQHQNQSHLEQHQQHQLAQQRDLKPQQFFPSGSLVDAEQVQYLDEQALHEPFQDSMMLLPESVVCMNSAGAQSTGCRVASPAPRARNQASVYTPLATRQPDSGHASSSGSLVLLAESSGSQPAYYSSSAASSSQHQAAADGSPLAANASQTLEPIKIQRLVHAPTSQPLYDTEPNCLDEAEVNPVDNEEDSVESELKVCEWDSCGNTFLSMQEFVKHLEERHVNQEPREKNRYYCLWANCKRNEQEFNARYKLLIHMRVHSGEKPYPCTNPDCKKSFSRLENLKIHVRSHTGEKPYKCNYDTCSKSFTNSSDRIKHHKTHRDPKPYSCSHPNCSKRYTDPSSLRKHLRAHKRLAPPQLTLTGPGASPPGSLPILCTADFDPTSLLDTCTYTECLSAHNQAGWQPNQRLELAPQHCQLSRSWCAGFTSSPGYSAPASLAPVQSAYPAQQYVWRQHETLMRSMPASYQPGQAANARASGYSSPAQWQGAPSCSLPASSRLADEPTRR